MDRQELEAKAREILLTNLRRGIADWNGKYYSFVCPSLTGYPFQWFWDSCFHAIALIHLDHEQAKAELTTLMSGAQPNGFIPHMIFWEMDKQPDFLSRNIVGMTSPNFSATMQPPIIAYAVERVYQATGDQEFLDNALPVLTALIVAISVLRKNKRRPVVSSYKTMPSAHWSERPSSGRPAPWRRWRCESPAAA